MSGKITINGKDITKPFIPFATGVHAGKKVKSITVGGKTLTFGPTTYKAGVGVSDETFKVGSDTIASYYVTMWSDWPSGTYDGFPISRNAQSDPSGKMIDLNGNPYYLWYRYASNNGWAQESHWSDNNKKMIDLTMVKKYCSKEDEYLSFEMMWGSTNTQSKLFDYPSAGSHMIKKFYIRYHNGQLQWKSDAVGTGNCHSHQDEIHTSWANLSEGSHQTNWLTNIAHGQAEIKFGLWVKSSYGSLTMYSTGRGTNWASWYGFRNFELVTYE